MAVKYRERLYFFSTSEAKTKFSASPELYTAGDGPLEVSLWCETAFTCMQFYNVCCWISVSCFCKYTYLPLLIKKENIQTVKHRNSELEVCQLHGW